MKKKFKIITSLLLTFCVSIFLNQIVNWFTIPKIVNALSYFTLSMVLIIQYHEEKLKSKKENNEEKS